MSAKYLRGNEYQESGRCGGERREEESEEKQQDRQSLFKGCRQDECSMCIKCKASEELSRGEEGRETEAKRDRGKIMLVKDSVDRGVFAEVKPQS